MEFMENLRGDTGRNFSRYSPWNYLANPDANSFVDGNYGHNFTKKIFKTTKESLVSGFLWLFVYLHQERGVLYLVKHYNVIICLR